MTRWRSTLAALALAVSITHAVPLLAVDGVSSAIGLNHVCVITAGEPSVAGGEAMCTGNSEFGKTTPPKSEVFVQLAVGLYFSCGLSADQRIHCWGQISGTPDDGLYIQISAGNYFACGLLIDGRLKCWGQQKILNALAFDSGQAGDIAYEQLSCGPESLCALTSEGYAKCWGSSGILQARKIVESPSNRTSYLQYDLVGDDANLYSSEVCLRQISVGDDVICGIRYPESDIFCTGALKKYSLPSIIEGNFLQVSVSSARLGVCAIRSDRSLQCWGQAKSLATFAKSNNRWDQVEVGPSTVCAVSMLSELECGGGNGIRIDFPKSMTLA